MSFHVSANLELLCYVEHITVAKRDILPLKAILNQLHNIHIKVKSVSIKIVQIR